jgi:hypothetical protein
MIYEYTILVGKPEGKRHLGRYRSRCEMNMKVNIKRIRY